MLKRAAYAAPVALLLVAGIAVYPAGDERLQGTWVLDPELLFELEQFQHYTEEQKAATRLLFQSIKIEFTFTGRRVRYESDLGGKREVKEGSYKVKSADGDRLVVAFFREDGWKENVVELHGDSIVIHHLGKRLPLRRK